MKKRQIIIPIFIPHKGCAFDCIYCNQKSISGQREEMTPEKMKDIVEEHLSTIPQDAEIEIGFYGGSFTGIEESQQVGFLEGAQSYIKGQQIQGIRLSTRPDYINDEILHRLKKYQVQTIELGVQSLDKVVLDQSHRGHTRETVIRAAEKIKKFGFTLGIQTMIGLPGDCLAKDIETAEKVIQLKPDIVRIYPTLVIKETPLEDLYVKGKYSPLTTEEAVDICAILLKMYQKENIKVIRVGLQATETINDGMDVIAGPFHPAFRQLVESKLALNEIEEKIEKGRLFEKEELILYTSKRNLSNVVGQKKRNVEYLVKKYGFKRVIIKEDPSIGE